MLRKIEYLIPAALQAIDEVLVKKYGKETIPSGYQSAISGFGTTIIQMGLLPTLAVYDDDEGGSQISRKALLLALTHVLKLDDKFRHKDSLALDKSLLHQYVDKSKPEREHLKEHLLHASLAFKLAIRTYKLKKS